MFAPAVIPAAARDQTAIAARVEALLGQMTPAEKVGQVNLVSRGDPIDGQLERVRKGEIGLMLNVVEPGEVRAYQAAARQSRLGIPLIMGLDAITVFRIAMPHPLALAATWNPALVETASRAVASETAANGVNWTFAPMVDLSRDPRWGRVVEGAGEDPVLASAMAAARVRGYRAGGLATAVKHFLGYGAPEGGRDYNGATISMSELHDRYLPPFRAALAAGSETVMAAFTTVNGVPVSADRRLLTGLLRERLGFSGFVTSDFNAIGELVNHGVAADLAEATRKAMTAGVDVDMEGAAYERHLADEVATGRVPQATLDEAVRRVLRVKIGMGLLDRPQPQQPTPPAEAEVRAVAREAARQSLVLLKNGRGALPITTATRKIAVVGAWAENDYDMSWWGPAGLTRPATETLLAALRARLQPGQTIEFARGFDDACGYRQGDVDGAVAAARRADLVVMVAAEDCDISGEGTSRAYLGLTGAQQGLLSALADAGKPIVLVVATARPLALTATEPYTAATLIAWYGGTEGRTAIAEALMGEVSPSGKLPMTFPRSVGQIPISHDALPTSRPPGEDRYTSRYIDEATTPLYPFGHGLSYARFDYSDLRTSAPGLPTADGG
ncbi:MAG: glycoside hydrolase family 3 N-terminal domain-containing protein, partial [Hyphomicrobium sp.]